MPTLNCPTVVLVEDDDLVAASVAMMIHRRGYSVLSFKTTEESFAHLASQPLDGCLILDLDSAINPQQATQLLNWIRELNWSIPIVLLSEHGFLPNELTEFRDCVVEVVDKPPSYQQLTTAIDRSLNRNSAPRNYNRVDLRSAINLLSSNEKAVLQLLLGGLSNKVIASRLDIGLRSAVRYRHSVLQKLGYSTIPELASAMGASGMGLSIPGQAPLSATSLPAEQDIGQVATVLIVSSNPLATWLLKGLLTENQIASGQCSSLPELRDWLESNSRPSKVTIVAFEDDLLFGELVSLASEPSYQRCIRIVNLRSPFGESGKHALAVSQVPIFQPASFIRSIVAG